MSFIWRLHGVKNSLIRPRIYTAVKSQIKYIKYDVVPNPKLPCHIDAKNACYKRPMSPHVTIYKFELHMIASLFHRSSGTALSVYFLTFGLGALVLPHELPYYVDWIKSLNLPSWLLMAGKAIFAFPLSFHAIGGLRHLIWDLGVFLNTMGAVAAIGYVSFAAAIGIGALLTLM